jgi:GT2 family glycosyltransferase
VLVRRHGSPVGAVEADLEHGELAADAARRIRARFGQHTGPVAGNGPANADPMPGGLAASVVIATHDRPEELRRCLDSVLATHYPGLQILVVDSAPTTTAAQVLVSQEYPGVRYLREDVPGLANAHNRGLEHVGTPIVAFTDDDVVVDRDWVRALVAAFAEHRADGHGGVGCVTGLIWPAELETAAQLLIDSHGRFAKGFNTRMFNLDVHRPADPLFPYTAGSLGSGANMAFRTDVLRALGGFDPLLGAGSPARGGDDLAAFADVVLAGYSLVYEPAALVHHRHRREAEDVRAQAVNYGVGLGAYLTRLAIRRPSVLTDFARLAPRAAAHLLHPPAMAGLASHIAYPRELILLQLDGLVLGVWEYLRAAGRTAQRSQP